MKHSIFKRTALAASIGSVLVLGGWSVPEDASALGFFPGFGVHPNKYLVIWNGDQVLDDGKYADQDFLAVVDADPASANYGHVVNTAVASNVGGFGLAKILNGQPFAPYTDGDAHLLAETENIVDNAVGGPGAKTADPLAPIPSGILNEAHHFNVKPRIDIANGHKYIYPGGLISGNLFGCDVTDPMHIKPSPGSQVGSETVQHCGLAIGSYETPNTSGTDDVMPLPNGNLIVTQMGFKGKITIDAANDSYPLDPSGATKYGQILGHTGAYTTITLGPGAPTSAHSAPGTQGGHLSDLPPALQTPGGLLEFDYQGNVVGEYPAAIPAGATYPASGPLAGQRIAPDRYRAHFYLGEGAVDPNNPLLFANKDPVTGYGIGTPSDTGPEAHPHGMGFRPDLNSQSPYWGYYHPGGMNASDASTVPNKGIFVESDYADPVSLAVSGGDDKFQSLGTTVRFFHLSNLADGPYAVVQVPDGNRVEDTEFHEEPEGLMAMAVTNRPSHKGMFVASMCGGTIYYSPDITAVKPQFREVYDFGACTGASVFFISRNDRYLVVPVAGLESPADNGGVASPAYNAYYPGEHDRRIVVLDIQKLLAKGSNMANVQCDAAPADRFITDPNRPQPGSGKPATVGSSNIPGHPEHTSTVPWPGRGTVGQVYATPTAKYWPNNGAADCPTIASVVVLNSHDNNNTHGGPHFTVADNLERYVATSQYFVDLRRYPVAGVWSFFNGVKPGAIVPFNPFLDPAHGGKDSSNTTQSLSNPNAAANVAKWGATGNNLGFSADFLPGTGSVGDDTVCMMKFNRWTGSLTLDTTFQDGTAVPGCIDMDRKDWPGARGAGAGNASPHAMTFIDKL